MKKDENLCSVREVLNYPAVELFQTSKNMHKFCYIDSPNKLTFWKYSTSNEDFSPSCCEEQRVDLYLQKLFVQILEKNLHVNI